MKPIFILFMFLIIGCSSADVGVTEVMMRINSHTVECVGEAEGNCLLVQEGDQIGTENWELFYFEDSIIGFDYEPGFIYTILVKKTPVKNPPMDGSSIEYSLVKILNKEEPQAGY